MQGCRGVGGSGGTGKVPLEIERGASSDSIRSLKAFLTVEKGYEPLTYRKGNLTGVMLE